MNPEQQAESTLKEAFPTVDAAVVKAILRASGGRIEPAFNALLGMSDPDAAEPPPPAQPPRPVRAPTGPRSVEEEQLAADERYARQLAEHYNGAAAYDQAPRSGSGTRRAPRGGAVREEALQDRKSLTTIVIEISLMVCPVNMKDGRY